MAPARSAATGVAGEPEQERGTVLIEVDVVRRIERNPDEGFQPVGGVQMVLYPRAQHAAPVLQERLGRLPVLWREVVGVLVQTTRR